MTIETRGTIEPKDIVAVEYECPKCRARTIRPLGQELPAVPQMCGNCNAIWLVERGQEARDLAGFLMQLARYKNGEFPFRLRFEVAGLADPRE